MGQTLFRSVAPSPDHQMAAMKAAMKKAPAMKAMKAAKAAKAMKAMKAKKVSKIGKGPRARYLVLSGKKVKTAGGMTKDKLTKNKTGRIVSKAASAKAKKAFASSALKRWADAAKKARKELKITGFCPVGGKTAQGKALYAKVKSILGK